jgi:hypothetical protein
VKIDFAHMYMQVRNVHRILKEKADENNGLIPSFVSSRSAKSWMGAISVGNFCDSAYEYVQRWSVF